LTRTSKYSSTDSVLIESKVKSISTLEKGEIFMDEVSILIVFPLVVLEIPNVGSPSI
jgi:hypothetical protein